MRCLEGVWWKCVSSSKWLAPAVLAGVSLKDINPSVNGLLIFFLSFWLIRLLKGRRQVNQELQYLKSKNREVQEREELLEKAIVNRDNRISLAAHEIKTPLTALKLQLALLKRDVGEKNRDSIELMTRQVDKLIGIISCYLDVTRISKDQLHLKIRKIHVSDLISRVFENYTPFLKENGMNYRLSCPKDLTCDCDPDRMEQVFVNLIANSTKHAPGSQIEVNVKKSEQDIFIQFSDRKKEGRNFNSINQKNQEGLGIGLFITKQIVEAHGGFFKSHFQNGRMEFEIILPLNLSEGGERGASLIPEGEDLFFVKSFLCHE